MDRLIYTAMTGAKHILEQQATTAHNLANATTTGFRAQLDSFRAVPVISDGLPTRAFVVDSTVGSDFTPGAIQQTGRDLDVAVQGKGWIAVESARRRRSLYAQWQPEAQRKRCLADAERTECDGGGRPDQHSAGCNDRHRQRRHRVGDTENRFS